MNFAASHKMQIYVIGTRYKTDAAIQLIRNALTAGIKADYVLMDTWFITEPMLKEILNTGIHAIGMVKQLKQRYIPIMADNIRFRD